jgi:1,2-phenylacetyl-CoA epoxidase PaaB subunit
VWIVRVSATCAGRHNEISYKKKENRHLDNMEKYYYIYKETKKGTQINDKTL